MQHSGNVCSTHRKEIKQMQRGQLRKQHLVGGNWALGCVNDRQPILSPKELSS